MKKIKLNLGSGNDYKEGWINVDADKDTRKDIYADLSKKFPFRENYADEIMASDILEHFIKEEGGMFLEECWRVLKINGKITIRTHNLYKIFEKFKENNVEIPFPQRDLHLKSWFEEKNISSDPI